MMQGTSGLARNLPARYWLICPAKPARSRLAITNCQTMGRGAGGNAEPGARHINKTGIV